MGRATPDDTTWGIDSEHVGNIRTRLEFGRELTRIRERAGLTVRDVARMVNIPVSTAGGYFSGTHLPPVKPPDILVRILGACGIDDPEMLDRWRRALTRARRAPGPRRAGEGTPYRGLARFEPEHAQWFHGREKLVADLVERAVANTGGGLLTVVGPSGSGKSSLLRAGLVASLSDLGWRPLILAPGLRPMLSLAEQLAALTGDDARKIAARLSAEPHLAPELTPPSDADQTRSALAGERIAIVVDQFEEVFTAGADEVERQTFVTVLAAAAGLPAARDGAAIRPGPAALVVIGMRADFYAAALRYPQLAEALQNAQVVVAPMGEAELRRAIVEPARQAKLTVDDGLVELLLRDLRPPGDVPPDVAHDAGALPLLSHALLSTWERGGGASLTTADYRDTGGIRGAVARTAEEAYASLTPLQQQLARRLFLRLVHVADDVADTRRYVPHTQIRQAGDGVQDVLDVFVGHRLITAQADRVTITHEALLTAWPRLRSWIDTDRAGLRIHRQLTAAAETWRGLGRDQSALYRGGRLTIATEWAAEPDHHAELDPIEREFLDASIAHALAEQQTARRRSRRMQQLLAALTALLVASAGSTAFALQQRAAADEQRNLAVARQVATVANQVRAKDAALAMQLSLVAYRIAAIPESRSSLLNSYGSPTVTRVMGPPGVMQTVAFLSNGGLMAAAGSDGDVRLWTLPHAGRPVPVGEPLSGHTDTVYSLAFSPDGRMLASAGGDRTIRLWDISDQGTPSAAGILSGPANTVYSVAFSPDGRTLAAGSADNTVRLFDVTHPGAARPLGSALKGFTGFVQSVAFSPDGRFLAAGSADTTVRLWDVRRPLTPIAVGTPLSGAAKTVYSVAFRPDGKALAAGSADGNVHLWDLVRPDRPVSVGRLTGPGTWVNSVAFSPDGRRIAAASSDSNLPYAPPCGR
ncbi:hypothetical protein E0H26_22740 [Micromonospora zingiberis]|uniref:HTH cro/C1-type domain-containing protein n=1 Tax=Micromonospora zingiberis TaxID=2053011 RepID=A0A4V6N369_9ACTN|nr:helix-turn-helix domain-containing protein [Micromonospora zingiberis]TCB93365.1 hypothetical protein E0H26_22740 [Micromonospora zingiberis]